jgi:LysR family hydrogen peroxide-inducible transcriptional activator
MLTPIGREIAERARKVIAEVDQMGEIARRSQDPEAGTVRLGIFPTLAPYLLPHVLPSVRKRFPRLELLLVEEKTDQILARLRDGRLDAGVLALPVHDDQLQVEPLFDEPFVLAVPQQHALAQRGSLKLRDLDHQHLLLLEEGHCLRDQALDVCHMAGADERDGFRATSLETLRQMVAAGVGITLLPVLAVQPPVPVSGDIQLLPFQGEAPHRRIAMVWRRSSAMAGFLQQLAGELRRLPQALLLPPRPAIAAPASRKRASRKRAGA